MTTDFTERLLIDAGLERGMRVVDIGCGRGDVTLLAARLVGDTGHVVGIDREPAAIAAARARVVELGVENIEFLEGDFATAKAAGGPFDAAVGRRVLMYQADATASVRMLAEAVRPGGTIVFQESDATLAGGKSALALHDRARAWIWRTVEREGGNLHMGFDLARVFGEAGLDTAHVRAEATLETPSESMPTGALLRIMLPRILAHGVATEAEMELDTLDARLDEERRRASATYVRELVFGAWARKPA